MVAAVIILYNPDMSLLDRLLRTLIGQVKSTYIIDNTPGSTANFSSSFGLYQGSISYVPLGENKGIATAQNIGIQKCMDAGCSHVLFLDQDSALSDDMVKVLLKAEDDLLRAGHKVAAVGPLFIEQKTGKPSHAIKHGFLWVRRIKIDPLSDINIESDYIISSGSLIRLSVLAEVGVMLDDLFIDWVDIEWGLRAKRRGYECFIVPRAILKHCLGDSTTRIPGRDIHLHNDTRNYYIVRNATYLLRLKTMGLMWRTAAIIKLPQYIIFYSWNSRRRMKSARLLVGAIMDGAFGRLGRLD